jgi:hypothetical protein
MESTERETRGALSVDLGISRNGLYVDASGSACKRERRVQEIFLYWLLRIQ